jgi:hypothetical protein
MLALCPTMNGDVQVILIGVLVTGSSRGTNFLNINVAADAIALLLKEKYGIR